MRAYLCLHVSTYIMLEIVFCFCLILVRILLFRVYRTDANRKAILRNIWMVCIKGFLRWLLNVVSGGIEYNRNQTTLTKSQEK